MSFNPIYYMCAACPTTEKTIEMADKYIAHGAHALQIDMPSKDPYAETDFVKSMMSNSLDRSSDYKTYMDAIREIRFRHPELELHVVVYHDVVDSIGLDAFIDFGKEINVASFMIPNNTKETIEATENAGITDMKIIVHAMPDNEVKMCVDAGKHNIVAIRNKKPGETDTPGLETYEKKYKFLRDKGVVSPIYSVFGISTKEALAAVKATGSDGAIIGNVLMRLWDDEYSLWKLLEEFNSLAE